MLLHWTYSRMSLFAPEIKVPLRISAKRLEEKFAEWQAWKDKEW